MRPPPEIQEPHAELSRTRPTATKSDLLVTAEIDGSGTLLNLGIRPVIAFTLMLGLAASMAAACSSGHRTRYTPPMKSTEAKLPDPCRLVDASTIGDLVGKSTANKAKGIHSYTAAQSPALDESKKEKTAARLATEVLGHLST